MRSFVSDILVPPAGSPIQKLSPVTSSRAIAAVLLDDAGLDPDSLGRGVTVFESPWEPVSSSVIGLVMGALLPARASFDEAETFPTDKSPSSAETAET